MLYDLLNQNHFINMKKIVNYNITLLLLSIILTKKTSLGILRPNQRPGRRIMRLHFSTKFERTEIWPNDIETFRIIYRWKGMEVYFLLKFMEYILMFVEKVMVNRVTKGQKRTTT